MPQYREDNRTPSNEQVTKPLIRDIPTDWEISEYVKSVVVPSTTVVVLFSDLARAVYSEYKQAITYNDTRTQLNAVLRTLSNRRIYTLVKRTIDGEERRGVIPTGQYEQNTYTWPSKNTSDDIGVATSIITNVFRIGYSPCRWLYKDEFIAKILQTAKAEYNDDKLGPRILAEFRLGRYNHLLEVGKHPKHPENKPVVYIKQ